MIKYNIVFTHGTHRRDCCFAYDEYLSLIESIEDNISDYYEMELIDTNKEYADNFEFLAKYKHILIEYHFKFDRNPKEYISKYQIQINNRIFNDFFDAFFFLLDELKNITNIE